MTCTLFHHFEKDLKGYKLPSQFTYPFYYTPHPLAVEASKQLQRQIKVANWDHDFNAIGKMFGVLVCRDQNDQLGFLAAVSGDLQNSPLQKLSSERLIMVPSICEPYDDRGPKDEVARISKKISELTFAREFIELKEHLIKKKMNLQSQLKKLQEQKQIAKKIRKQRRQDGENPHTLNKESIKFKKKIISFKKEMKTTLLKIERQIELHQNQIQNLEIQRKNILQQLQQKRFASYRFINCKKKTKNLNQIFENRIPPAGAGDCAAPKLLQYAFQNDLVPLCMAEFWWGAPHKSSIRKHKHFYPACRSKCEPILMHMLSEIQVENNPMLINYGKDKNIEIIHEDSDIVIINKPEGLLSVPGKNIQDSVASRLNGLRIIHRLDQETSGLMILAKNKQSHFWLQKQFTLRKIKKVYKAILVGDVKKDAGVISLPLRVDLDNRPQQIVCYKFGKEALTQFKVIKRNEEQTYIEFYPQTGRTHQLRVHSAHPDGLNSPIKGDTLYGTAQDRLYLHAFSIEFIHPISKKVIYFESDPEFY